MSENKSLIITMLLSTIILVGWHYFYEAPATQKKIALEHEKNQQKQSIKEENENLFELKREELIQNTNSQRVQIYNSRIKGSINLRGLRIDDITLEDYKETIEDNGKKVTLFNPAQTKDVYFAEFGWVTLEKDLELPNSKSLWKADKKLLETNGTVNLKWINSAGIEFIVKISLDSNYMFNILQEVINNSSKNIKISSYGLIHRKMQNIAEAQSILHEGMVGSSNNILYEESYSKLENGKEKKFKENRKGDWIGVTDKYWLSAIIPAEEFISKIIRKESGDKSIFQSDCIAKEISVAPLKSIQNSSLLFVGAKKLNILDNYTKKYGINLFDRAVDFGWFYFLTKPIFIALQYLDGMTGNFGLAILLLTVFIKLIMYPLANKSFHSMNKMKALSPQIAILRERYAEDKVQLNREMMELYKREKINPLSGCLPLVLQIPVFFSLYKVLYVTLEMRQAPFYGWIKDLSAPDPTSIFNLFGLVEWHPPSFLMIGAWPIIMALTMYFQQNMSPPPADPVQAKVMKFLPLIFVFMFGSFPVGLVIYWAWNNILSIMQQYMIDQQSKSK